MVAKRVEKSEDPKPQPQVRMVRAVIQFELFIDDGDHLIPIGTVLRDEQGNPGAVSAVVDAIEWPTYASGRFLESMKELEAKIQEVMRPVDLRSVDPARTEGSPA